MISHCAVSVNSRVTVTLKIRSCKKEVNVPLDFFLPGPEEKFTLLPSSGK